MRFVNRGYYQESGGSNDLCLGIWGRDDMVCKGWGPEHQPINQKLAKKS